MDDWDHYLALGHKPRDSARTPDGVQGGQPPSQRDHTRTHLHTSVVLEEAGEGGCSAAPGGRAPLDSAEPQSCATQRPGRLCAVLRSAPARADREMVGQHEELVPRITLARQLLLLFFGAREPTRKFRLPERRRDSHASATLLNNRFQHDDHGTDVPRQRTVIMRLR